MAVAELNPAEGRTPARHLIFRDQAGIESRCLHSRSVWPTLQLGELRDAAARIEEARKSSALELLDALESIDPELVKEGLDLTGPRQGKLLNVEGS